MSSMIITFYELLGMVKDGIHPKKFRYGNVIFKYDEKDCVYRDLQGVRFHCVYPLHQVSLNDEVEILEEEKKIEPLKMLRHSCNFDRHEEALYENQVDLAIKITEILDYLKSKGE